MDVKALLANKTALYVVLFASVASLLGYVVGGRTNAVLFFLLTGYVASHFTKNMIVILLAPLLLTNFVFSVNRMREGLESKNKKREPTDEELEEAEGEDNAGGADPASVAIGAAMAGHEDDVSEDAAPVGRKAGKKAKANAKAKAKAADDDDSVVQPHPEVDKKKTKDMAFSYIDKMLGDDGISKLSDGMNDMVDKHQKLEKMIESMAPIIDKAGGLLDKVGSTDMSGIENMVKKMGGLLSGVM